MEKILPRWSEDRWVAVLCSAVLIIRTSQHHYGDWLQLGIALPLNLLVFGVLAKIHYWIVAKSFGNSRFLNGAGVVAALLIVMCDRLSAPIG